MANNFDPYIPEWWAMETIRILKNKMVVANLVHRDFEPMFQKYGDVVNTRKPRTFVAKHKSPGDEVTVQNAQADNIDVKLDQHVHVSFEVEDEFDNKSMKQLVEEFVEPAALALAEDVDRKTLGHVYQFIANQAGTIGGLTDSNAVTYLTALDRVMSVNKVPEAGRQLIINPYAAERMLQNATFHQADRLGDAGTALREASLGRKFGFDIWKCQGAPYVSQDAAGTGTGAINNAAGYPAGTTVLTVDGFGASEVVPGNWVTINGYPYQVIASDNATATQVTLSFGLKAAVADNDVISVMPDTTVNEASGVVDGWRKYITLTAVTAAAVGRGVTFGTSQVKYTIVEVVGSTVRLDRPLAAALANGDAVNFMPHGGFNIAFVRQAVALVLRPLKAETDFGSKSATINYDGIPMRAEISRDAKAQKKLVTLDFLMGIKLLDVDRGAVLLT